MLDNIKIPGGLINRPILKPINKELAKGEKVIIILGARQTGKSSLIYLLINRLLNTDRIPQKQIFYFDAERINTATLLDKFTSSPEDLTEHLKNRGAELNNKVFVFIDEVQYLTSPSKLVKFVHDHYQSIIFIISGSSSLDIKKKFTDRLTGRSRTFKVSPLSFSGFLQFTKRSIENEYLNQVKKSPRKNKEDRFKPDTDMANRLTKLYEHFIVYGGYPGVAKKAATDDQIVELEGIYSDYIRKDVKDIANIEDTIGYNRLVGLLAGQIGGLVNESELTSSSALSRPTVRKYLALLEGTFVIHRLAPYYKNPRQEFVKMPKVYFEDTGLRNMVLRNFDLLPDRVDRGHLVENAVFLQAQKDISLLEELFFWRTQSKAEVDIIIRGAKDRLTPVEVKYRSFSRPQIPSGLRSFINKYEPAKAYVATRDFWGEAKAAKTRVCFLPAWAV